MPISHSREVISEEAAATSGESIFGGCAVGYKGFCLKELINCNVRRLLLGNSVCVIFANLKIGFDI